MRQFLTNQLVLARVVGIGGHTNRLFFSRLLQWMAN